MVVLCAGVPIFRGKSSLRRYLYNLFIAKARPNGILGVFLQTHFKVVRNADIKMLGFLRRKGIDVFHVVEIIGLAER